MLVFGACMLSGCSDSDENPDEPIVPEVTVTDLSAAGKANCYIVQSPGQYKFEATNQFNLGEGLPVPPQIHPASAKLIWQTVKGSLNSVELIEEDGLSFVTFEVAQAAGNALLAVCNEAGDIEWSWHIWMPEEDIYSVASLSGYEVMNMNLGATNNLPGDAGAYGMLYQWGRKDPFPAAATLTGDVTTVSAPMYDLNGKEVTISNSSWTDTENNTLEYALSHPTVCLSNYAQYFDSRDWLRSSESDDSLWGNPLGDSKEDGVFINKGAKTCYDPSPAGWRVPPADVFSHFTTTSGYAWVFEDFNVADINKDNLIDLNDYNYGWHFLIREETPLYFPAAARFDGSYAMLMGSVSGVWGNYWSNSPHESMTGGASCALAFQVKDQNGNDMVTMSPSAYSSRADAFSVRCIRE